MMLPFLEVEHLPSSSSFYSAIVQPLGFRYLSTESGHFPVVTYGNASRTAPVFQIRQVVASRDRPLRTSRIVVSVPSLAAADDAYEFALRANPDREPCPRHFAEGYAAASGASAHRTSTSGGGTRVFITDFDGNMIEIVYQPPPEYPTYYSGSTVRRTNSTNEEAARILEWNYDVASNSLPTPRSSSGVSTRTATRRSYARYPEDDDQPQAGLRRSVTAAGSSSSVYEPATSARENSNGLSAGAVVGTLLGVAGVAAGAALTYNMVNRDKDRSSRHEYDMPSFTRRSTYPERYDGYSDRDSDHKTRYVDVERAVDKVRYTSDYPPPSGYRRPPPEYIARYTTFDSPRSRDVDDSYADSRGRQPSSRSRASSTRGRSESANHREPYEAEHRSYVSSRSSRHPPIVQRSYTYDTADRDRDSYVSARSHRSNSTVRAPPPPSVDAYDDLPPARPRMSSHSRSASRVTTTTYRITDSPRAPSYSSREGSYVSARHVPLPASRATTTYISPHDVPLPPSRATTTYISPHDVPLPASRSPTYISARDASRPGTYVSARNVPLPPSKAGSRWDVDDGAEEEDDADSIAPSDSISCVGSRRR
ncbi:hypothetical protein VTI74DRAFT_7356 [Chaetomium olivicolor]